MPEGIAEAVLGGHALHQQAILGDTAIDELRCVGAGARAVIDDDRTLGRLLAQRGTAADRFGESGDLASRVGEDDDRVVTDFSAALVAAPVEGLDLHDGGVALTCANPRALDLVRGRPAVARESARIGDHVELPVAERDHLHAERHRLTIMRHRAGVFTLEREVGVSLRGIGVRGIARGGGAYGRQAGNAKANEQGRGEHEMVEAAHDETPRD